MLKAIRNLIEFLIILIIVYAVLGLVASLFSWGGGASLTIGAEKAQNVYIIIEAYRVSLIPAVFVSIIFVLFRITLRQRGSVLSFVFIGAAVFSVQSFGFLGVERVVSMARPPAKGLSVALIEDSFQRTGGKTLFAQKIEDIRPAEETVKAKASSSSAFLSSTNNVTGVRQADALIKNLIVISHSGSAPNISYHSNGYYRSGAVLNSKNEQLAELNRKNNPVTKSFLPTDNLGSLLNEINILHADLSSKMDSGFIFFLTVFTFSLCVMSFSVMVDLTSWPFLNAGLFLLVMRGGLLLYAALADKIVQDIIKELFNSSVLPYTHAVFFGVLGLLLLLVAAIKMLAGKAGKAQKYE